MKKIKWSKYYKNGDCPDCGKKIDSNIQDFESCENCGHVFSIPKK